MKEDSEKVFGAGYNVPPVWKERIKASTLVTTPNSDVAYSASPGMVVNMVNAGAKYPVTFRDKDGNFLDGGQSYRLHLPPNIPAKNFWSATVYDGTTASGLDNGQSHPSLNQMDKPVQNADGSTDLYFGPTAPAGKEKNWLRTLPGKGYFVIFRLYSPEQAFFDQSWKPDDIVKVK